ncbi:MAG TPA: SPOR domain-containing protein [Gammaproteobacteria bacterium]|nr:SPOR domain-containing protein [Gammaproteobacteria bacterium]
MAKDYKNTARSKAKKKAPKPTPGWVWMLGGLFIGLLVALLVYLRDDLQIGDERTTSAPVVEKSQIAPKQTTKNDKPREQTDKKPRFDFYNLLPEMEVFIPPQELAGERERKAAKESIAYYLQVGSFRRTEDADRMRAQLALNNVESHIQRVTINDSQTWYRVRVGPFQSARKMDIVRNRLRAQSIDPMVLKVK